MNTECVSTLKLLHEIRRSESDCDTHAAWSTEAEKLRLRAVHLRQLARLAFADANGWRLTKCPFTLRKLGRMSTSMSDQRPLILSGGDDTLDHLDYFRERQRPWEPVALVTQPYEHVTAEDVNACARQYGLVVHESPIKYASWWLPGKAQFFVLARPERTVRWLQEQTRDDSGEFLRFAPCRSRNGQSVQATSGVV